MLDDELIQDPDLIGLFIEGMASVVQGSGDLVSKFRTNPLIRDLIEQPPVGVISKGQHTREDDLAQA